MRRGFFTTATRDTLTLKMSKLDGSVVDDVTLKV